MLFRSLLEAGALEKQLALFRRNLFLLRRPEEVSRWFAPRTVEELQRYHQQHWDGLRWRLLLRHSPLPAGARERILQRMPLIPGNFLLHRALTGEFSDLEAGYPSLSVAGHARIQPRALSLQLLHGDPLLLIQQTDNARFSCIFLGNLLEKQAEPLLLALLPKLRPQAQIGRAHV